MSAAISPVEPTTMKPARRAYEIRVQRLNGHDCALRLDSPGAAIGYWRSAVALMPWHDAEREMVVAVLVNTRMRVIGHALVGLGSINESIVHPRDVFRAAVALNSWGILLMHNHPSGDPSPSDADRRLTRRLSEGSSILQIDLLDHIVVGEIGAASESGYFSFKEAGLL